MSTSSRTDGSQRRLPEIDILKGVAILWVFAIHADPIPGTLLFKLLINRAVPVFLVLFGFTSALWWSARSAESWSSVSISWLSSRLTRLGVPLWSAVALWWTARLAIEPAPDLAEYGHLAAAVFGYLPWLGTSWFVTLVAQLVLLFPLLYLLRACTGPVLFLVLGGLATILSYAYLFPVVGLMRALLFDSVPGGIFSALFYFSIFPPVHLWGIAGGMLLASYGLYRRPLWVGLAAGCWGVLAWQSLSGTPFTVPPLVWSTFADLPLVVVLLATASFLAPRLRSVVTVLVWLGVHSWGLYVSQMLIHNVLQSSRAAAVWTPEDARVLSAVRLFLLAGGSCLLVSIGNRLRRLLSF